MSSEPRTTIPVRLKTSGVEWLDRLVKETGQNRSEVVRAAFAVARSHETEVKNRLKEKL